MPELASAGCVNTFGVNYLCSGAETTGQVVSANNATILTSTGFGVNTSDPSALEINGLGNIYYLDTHSSNLTGRDYGLRASVDGDIAPGMSGNLILAPSGSLYGGIAGLRALNFSTGPTYVATTGHVEGGLRGIDIFNASSSTEALRLETSTVTGGNIGIDAQHLGGGTTSVSASGQVTGTNWYGIVVSNNRLSFASDGNLSAISYPVGSTPTDVIVKASGGVTGGLTGVLAWNGGSGELRVDTRGGAVSGGTRDGIVALNYAVHGAPTNLSVTTDAVNGARHGIVSINGGSGSNTVTTHGAVAGGTGYGIAAFNGFSYAFALVNDGDVSICGTAGTDLTVTANGTVSGGLVGIYAGNNGTGATHVTATGHVAGAADTGIGAQNAATATDLTIEAASVTGGQTGIAVTNRGIGATRVTATSHVEGTGNIGIYAGNEATATNLTVEASSVTGGLAGISAINDGSGATRVVATGHVVGAGNVGIAATNDVTAKDLTIEAASVSGGRNGISAQNFGVGGYTHVIATGHVEGAGDSGIRAINFARTLGLTVEAASVAGGVYGIAAGNSGTGATRVVATGHVEGTSEAGIRAQNFATARDLTIEAVSAKGGLYGIHALNEGTGGTRIVATGHVQGVSETGIVAENAATGTDLSIDAASVTAGTTGIRAVNNGTALTRVTATGHVEGADGNGISAFNAAAATDLTVMATSVAGRRTGISAVNDGTGTTWIMATGDVIGRGDTGIHAFNAGTATGLTIDAAGARGDIYGIRALNYGSGVTSITTNGLVEGAIAISAHSAGQPIVIETNGLVRNVSQLSTDLAVEGSGGPIVFTNKGGLIGTVQFGAGANFMTNNAPWNTSGGANEFGGAHLTNAAGIVITAAGSAGVAETTLLNGLGSFANHGVLSMADGGTGDTARQAGGNVRFEAGSVLAVDIDGMGRSDRFITAGTATLTGATLAVSPMGMMPAYGMRYTVLTADAGLTGQFASVSGLPVTTAFLTIQDSYDANNAYLDIIKYRAFANAGLTRNQIATGHALDSLGPGPVVNAVAALATDAQARHAFDQISGEIHASAKTAMIEDSRFIRNAVNDRLRGAFGGVGTVAMPVVAYADGSPHHVPATTGRFAVWGQAFGSWGRWNGDGNAARLNRSIGGFFVGGDAPVFDTWRFGAVAGYSRTSFNVRDRASSGSSDNYHVGFYGGTAWGALAFRAGAAYTWHDMSTGRSVIFPGFGDGPKGQYRAATAQVFGELAYGFGAGGARFEPFANLAHVNLHTAGFSEGRGAAALTGTSSATGATFATLGLRASATFDLGAASLTAKGMLGWRHVLGDATPLSTMRLAGSDAFTIAGVPIARNAAVIEAGLDYGIMPNATLGISYGGQFGSGALDQSLRANFNMKF
ncbi:Extracellular serine protease precursor [bacterium YEK0313]|nr:Extracellular serine protease precursor [bacterium YEK0313]